MPHATLPPLTRRAFSLSLVGVGVSLLQSAQSEMHWALMSDLHIPANPADAYRGFKPQDNLKRIIPDILEAKPEGALICGDVARLTGLTADYEAARALLPPVSEKMPMALALGNHDHSGNFLGVFGKSAERHAERQPEARTRHRKRRPARRRSRLADRNQPHPRYAGQGPARLARHVPPVVE
jgi:Calcineurin-like phosphoesterase